MQPTELVSTAEATFNTTDTLWVLISAALVFFMQAGFKVLETGLVKEEHRSGIGIKNLMDWVAGSLAFFIIGFGFMFGESVGGIIGTNFFLGLDFADGYTYVFFIFQLAFAGTALTIVSGAMSGRTALAPYFVASLFTAVIIYPIFGHWAWGNLLIESNKPWLASLGFMDFAGSTVVHSVGAWVGLVGIYMVGPRLGRYNALGKVQPIKASDYSYSVLGVMILWFGWWGFNGGSTLAFDESVPKIILNTNLAAAAACLSAYIHVKFFQNGEDIVEKIIGGCLTGLVAITACCNVVTPISSILIGLLAGLVHNISYVLISEKWKVDDPVGAIPVHGFGGVLGTLCVAFFGQEELLIHDRWTQLGVQAIGVVTCIVFTMGVSYVVFYLVKVSIGLRLSPKQELLGDTMGGVFLQDLSEELSEKTVSQVSVRMGERSYNLFKVDEYLGLPRETRIGLVRTDSVQYLDGAGNDIPALQAVRFLSGILESQKNSPPTKEELVELSLYEDKKEASEELQRRLFKQEQSIFSVFPDSFVFLHPKQEVSSDFFWHGKVKEYNIVIVASCVNPKDDACTFTSSIVMSQLNEIVSINKVLAPEKILDQLDQNLRIAIDGSSFKKDANGVDVGILLVDNNRRKVYYSAAGTGVHLYVKKLDQKVTILNGIDVPLGGDKKKQFNRKQIDFSRGDSFLLFSDGYGNQLNESGKRLRKSRLRNIFMKNVGKSMDDLQFIITRDFESWRGQEEQTEDILVIGIKP